MGVEFYSRGFTEGTRIASSCKREIRLTSFNFMAGLAGRKLESEVKFSGDMIARMDSWKTGFFDGFMQKAEEIKGETK